MTDAYQEGFLLIVDDSDDDYDIMQMALQKCDFSVKAHRRCKDGQEALDYLLQRGDYAEPGAAPTPNLILLDLNMPGMDGRETLRVIKNTAGLRNIPVVVMTNSDNERDVSYCYDQGANSYVRKSLDWKGFVKVIGVTLAFWMGAAMMPSQANAANIAQFDQTTITQSVHGNSLIEAEEVSPPRGFAEMCQQRPELCPAESVRGDVAQMSDKLASLYGDAALSVEAPELTPARLAALNRVNTVVNASIAPRNDAGPDHWDLGGPTGDCEDYVLMKRELLAKLGWPRSAMRITVVHDGNNYHAVLVAATQQGEFVLDNMAREITSVEDSPYEFIVAQSLTRSGAWVRVTRG